jgi:hypothetical protein
VVANEQTAEVRRTISNEMGLFAFLVAAGRAGCRRKPMTMRTSPTTAISELGAWK